MYRMLFIPPLIFIIVLMFTAIYDTQKKIDRIQNPTIYIPGTTGWDCNPKGGKLNCQMVWIPGTILRRGEK